MSPSSMRTRLTSPDPRSRSSRTQTRAGTGDHQAGRPGLDVKIRINPATTAAADADELSLRLCGLDADVQIANPRRNRVNKPSCRVSAWLPGKEKALMGGDCGRSPTAS